MRCEVTRGSPTRARGRGLPSPEPRWASPSGVVKVAHRRGTADEPRWRPATRRHANAEGGAGAPTGVAVRRPSYAVGRRSGGGVDRGVREGELVGDLAQPRRGGIPHGRNQLLHRKGPLGSPTSGSLYAMPRSVASA